ncbi:hypothetical protein [Microcella flavibacter]|uniref:hypothetical protein n=1 Tax=Microcella flavibacter TaxID=1804990 RepID=UPI0014567298|nr:hypothetical protein [Microcella flavibacter]
MTTLTITLPATRRSIVRPLGRRLALAVGIALVRWSRAAAVDATSGAHADQQRALAAQRATERARSVIRYGYTQ